MSRKERTTIRRKNYHAWKQEQSQPQAVLSETAQESLAPAPAPGHSTGPRTEAGLARSSQNARKHGLSSITSGFVTLPGEDPQEWVQLVDDLNSEFNPGSRTERILVNDMAQSHWLTQRAINLQTKHINDPKTFALYLRYQTMHHRAHYRALKQLLVLQKVRAHSGAPSRATRSALVSEPAVVPERSTSASTAATAQPPFSREPNPAETESTSLLAA